jgi:RNA-splicing ligase RtcB
VARITVERQRDWSAAIKVMAAAFKEASAERAAIWESVRETFDQNFPGYYHQVPAPVSVQNLEG